MGIAHDLLGVIDALRVLADRPAKRAVVVQESGGAEEAEGGEVANDVPRIVDALRIGAAAGIARRGALDQRIRAAAVEESSALRRAYDLIQIVDAVRPRPIHRPEGVEAGEMARRKDRHVDHLGVGG